VVPAMAGELVNEKIAEHFDTSGVVLVGSTAAALPPAVAAGLARQFPNADVVNTYTSTEAAPAQTMIVFDPARPGSVGRPAPGEVRVTDSLGRPSPPGETGDVWLRTGAATRTYFGDPQASAAVFAGGWTRMGDVGRLDEDGYLHLVDRETDLITSGAYKISTLAVEDVLYGYPGVREAAVVGVRHPVMGQMVAAVLVADDGLDLSTLRAYVAERLPRHEVPTRYLFVERIPRNAGGKPVKDELRRMFSDDSRHLGSGDSGDSGDSDRSNAVSTPLAELWRRVLRLRRVPSDADFFALGGDSLRGTQLAMLVTEELRAPVGSSFVFDHPLLADQEKQIAAVSQAPDGGFVPDLVPDTDTDTDTASATDPGPPASALMPAAEHFVGWMREHPAAYPEPISIALRIRDRLDEELVRATMAALIQRHTALRTVLDPVTSAPVVLDEGAAEVVWLRCAPEEAEAHAVAAVERRFDPARGPLVRVHILQTAAEDHVLVLVVDHLVFDGWSLGIVLREFGLCYDALRRGSQPSLPELPDAAAYQRWIVAQYPRTVPRWARHLDGAPRAMLLPGQRADARQCVGAEVTRELSPAFGDRWRARAAAYATTPFVVGLAAWADVLTELSGEPEVVLWAALAGRLTPESESLVGPYPMVPYLRLQASRGAAFPELVAAARAEVDFAVDNQCYPYERFRPAVRFAGAFAYEKWQQAPHIPGLESERFPLPQGRTLMTYALPGEPDLTGTLMRVYEQADGGIVWRLIYNSAAIDSAAITRVEAAFHDRLQEVL
ncbi:MAG: AMP-binding protein, partial [Catenulispora sp.]|nr:AMP-binding protein [Catenulispora sp.]